MEQINSKLLASEGRVKRYRDRIEQYRQNMTFKNNKRNFYQQEDGECQQQDAKEAKQFGSKIWERKERNRKDQWINKMEKDSKKALRRKYTSIHPKQ